MTAVKGKGLAGPKCAQFGALRKTGKNQGGPLWSSGQRTAPQPQVQTLVLLLTRAWP